MQLNPAQLGQGVDDDSDDDDDEGSDMYITDGCINQQFGLFI